MKNKSPVKTASVHRRESYEQSQLRALRVAQAAAHRVMDVIDATRECGPIPADGPRTGSHPMATRLDPPQTRGPQEPATTIPEGCTMTPARQQLASADRAMLIALSLIAAILLGMAMGRLL